MQAPPARQSTLTRAFVRTIGRLGRWKRVFQPKSAAAIPKEVAPLIVKASTVSAFDLEINASADLLTINRNVEDYLKNAQPPTGSANTSGSCADKQQSPALLPPAPLLSSTTTTDVSSHPSSVTLSTPLTTHYDEGSMVKPSQALPPSPESPLASHSLPSQPTPLPKTTLPSPPPSPRQIVPEAISPTSLIKVLDPEYSDVSRSSNASSLLPSHTEPNEVSGSRRAESFRSSSTDSFGVPLTSDGPPPTFKDTRTPWQFTVVSIDDLDFSDTSSLPGGEDPNQSASSRKQRKLPMRREFELVRRSQVSSMGIVSHHSVRDSVVSGLSETSTSSAGTGPKPIQRWQMKSLQQTFEDMNGNGDEKGDVEAALRRLEGQINPRVLQENAEKVNGWVRNLQERMANGDYESSVYSEEIEDFIDEVDSISPLSTADDLKLVVAQTMENEDGTSQSHTELRTNTSVPSQAMRQLPTPPSLEESPTDISNSIENVVPVEILQSRMSSAPTSAANLAIPTPPSSKFALEAPRMNASFIHSCAPEQLARHFTMIDRELFMSVKFEELVTGEWLDCEEMDILDWAQYLKDRARWKAESRCANKTTALAALRARFNLTVAFVNAEVVLTPSSERLYVVRRFIWVAWVSSLGFALLKYISKDIFSTVTSLATSKP